MNTSSNKNTEFPEKSVVVCKRDLEKAIKDGVISVESGTTLWRSWRDREKQSARPSPLVSLKSALDEELILRFVCYAMVLAGILSSLIFSWGQFGLPGAAVLCIFLCLIFSMNAFRLSRLGRAFERDVSALTSVLFATLTLYILAIFLDFSFIAAQPKVDVFGVVPADDSGRVMSLSAVSAIATQLFRRKFSSKTLTATLLIACVLLVDAAAWMILNLVLPVSEARVWSTAATFLTCFFYLKHMNRQEKRISTSPLLSTTNLLCSGLVVALFYTFGGDLSPLYLFLIGIVTFLRAASRKLKLLKLFSVAAMATSIVISNWSSLGTMSATLVLFLSSAGVFAYCKNMSLIDINISSGLRKLFGS
jgi:hypothetical protein